MPSINKLMQSPDTVVVYAKLTRKTTFTESGGESVVSVWAVVCQPGDSRAADGRGGFWCVKYRVDPFTVKLWHGTTRASVRGLADPMQTAGPLYSEQSAHPFITSEAAAKLLDRQIGLHQGDIIDSYENLSFGQPGLRDPAVAAPVASRSRYESGDADFAARLRLRNRRPK